MRYKTIFLLSSGSKDFFKVIYEEKIFIYPLNLQKKYNLKTYFTN